jgi:hypothetical protein
MISRHPFNAEKYKTADDIIGLPQKHLDVLVGVWRTPHLLFPENVTYLGADPHFTRRHFSACDDLFEDGLIQRSIRVKGFCQDIVMSLNDDLPPHAKDILNEVMTFLQLQT